MAPPAGSPALSASSCLGLQAPPVAPSAGSPALSAVSPASRKPGRFLAFSTGCAMLLLCAAAPAREGLEEMVVTAQKREQNIQEVPVSISRLSGQRLAVRFTGGEDALALAAAAPSLYAETSSGRLAPRFYMRGLGNADFTAAASQPVSFVFDGAPMEKLALRSFPLFDLDDIEVIRGPQGTLFGRNATAGIIKFDSRRPTAAPEGYVKMSGGNKGAFNVEAALGGALVKNVLSGRVSLLRQQRANWIDNAYTEKDDVLGGFVVLAGRAQLLWTPVPGFSAWIMHQRQDQDGNSATAFRANVLTRGSNELNENYDRGTVWFDGGGNNPGVIKSHGSTVKLDWDVGGHRLTSITSYQDVYDRLSRGDIDGGCTDARCPGATAFPVDTGSALVLEQLTQEVRLAAAPGGALHYQLGAFYFNEDFRGHSLNAEETALAEIRGIGVRSVTEIDNTAWAVFGQASVNPYKRLTLTAGVRYTDDQKDAVHTAPAGSSRADFISGLEPISLGDDNVSWDAALAWALDETGSSQVYARLASGFRAPVIQDRIDEDPEVTTARSETIMSYEVGYKALWERLRFNLAAFYYEVDDMQLVAVGGASNSVGLLNAEQGIGYGVELDLDYALNSNLILSGGFGYNRTKFNAKGLTAAPCGSGLCTVLDPLDENGFALIDGNPFQHAPQWTLNVELDYTRPLFGAHELYFYTDWKIRGKTSDFLYESIEYTFGTQFEGGLRVGWRNRIKNWEAGLFARNITNEHNPIGGIDFTNNTSYVNQPRIWGAEASYRF